MSTTDDEGPAPFTVQVTLRGDAQETLFQLFLHGPTWDGNIVSKAGREQLFELKLAARVEGWTYLTTNGVQLSLASGLERRKEKRQREQSREIDAYRRIAEIVNPPAAGAKSVNDLAL